MISSIQIHLNINIMRYVDMFLGYIYNHYHDYVQIDHNYQYEYK